MKTTVTLLFISIISIQISCKNEKSKTHFKPHNISYNKAWHFVDHKITDSSFFYFNKAKGEFSEKNDSVGVAKCLINMAVISGDQGDYFGSQEMSLNAISYLNERKQQQREIASSNYNNLGKISQLFKEYDEANEFYNKAISLSNDKASKNIYVNNIALNLSDQKQYTKALENFAQLMQDKDIKNNKQTFARLLTNISTTKWLSDATYNPVPNFLKALDIRKKENDLWGQNSSYSHLADYYLKTKPDIALAHANKMYRIAKKLNSADDQLLALQKLIRLSNTNQSKQYFEIYEKLDDSIQTARNAAKNQFALIRYETEKSKADNLKLQQENTEKKLQLFRQKMILIAIVLFLVLGLVSAKLWYKKRKQALALEAQNAIRDSQLKTSKKIHDVVANGLYRIMTKLDNQEAFKNDPIIDEMEVLYEKSRNISYEENQFSSQKFNQKIAELLKSFASPNIKVLIVGNDAILWEKISDAIKYELEHILQELMVNMKKHSKASSVVLRFEQKENVITIYYTDNGIGMAKDVQFKNGLANTGNRMKNIKGNINFENNNEKGLSIMLSFPVS